MRVVSDESNNRLLENGPRATRGDATKKTQRYKDQDSFPPNQAILERRDSTKLSSGTNLLSFF